MKSRMLFICTSALACALGCASEQATKPPTASPVTTRTDTASARSKSAEPAASEAPATGAEPESPPADEPFRLVRTPKDIVTAADTSFVSNLSVSEAYEQIERQCEGTAGEDMKQRTECLRHARDKYGTKVVRFVNKRGAWWWVTYERRGNQLVTLHKIPFSFGDETEQTVTLLPTGKDEGLAPLGSVPRKVTVTVPNEYSIELKDPVYGSVVYEAKIGITEG